MIVSVEYNSKSQIEIKGSPEIKEIQNQEYSLKYKEEKGFIKFTMHD